MKVSELDKKNKLAEEIKEKKQKEFVFNILEKNVGN